MNSLILYVTSRLILPLLLLFSIFLLLRGHYQPGGGFVGGLIASTGFALYTFSSGLKEARRALRVHPTILIGNGLFLAVLSGVPALFVGEPFLTAQWLAGEVPVLGVVGTPLIFDIGVYLTVIGVTLSIIFDLAEE